MSYYKVKKISINRKSNKINMVVACNNVRPITYFETEYGADEMSFEEKLFRMFKSIYEGNLVLLSSVAKTLKDLTFQMQEWIDFVTRTSQIDRLSIMYKVSANNEMLELFAKETTRLFINNLEISDAAMENFSSEFCAKVGKLFKDEAQKWEKADKLPINYASSSSIYKGYDIVRDYNNNIYVVSKDDYTIGCLSNKRKYIPLPVLKNLSCSYMVNTFIERTLEGYYQGYTFEEAIKGCNMSQIPETEIRKILKELIKDWKIYFPYDASSLWFNQKKEQKTPVYIL